MADEFLARPTAGRVVSLTRHAGLGDVRSNGRMRLDAFARFLQDVADYDAVTGEAEGSGIWVLRRLALRIARTPRFRADVHLSTWCSGVGPRWAERRTDLVVGEGLVAEAAAIWVHVDAERGVPLPLPRGFDERWGVTAAGRRVRATLQHPAPPADATVFAWPLRAVDLDIVGHVNNAAYWAPVEEELARRGHPVVTRAEIEFRGGLDRDDPVECSVAGTPEGFMCWLRVDGDVRASALVHCKT